MSFNASEMTRARDGVRTRIPKALRLNLNRANKRLGPYGVRVARTLVAQDTGETARSISYGTVRKRGRGGGWYYALRVFIDADDRLSAIRAFVIEFGRGQGRAGTRARGTLPPRPYIRPSRELVAKRARGAYSKAMRDAARQAFA